MTFEVGFTPEALAMIREIRDRRIRGQLLDRASKLSEDPEKQGKPLGDELAGFRSVRSVGQRYRIIYRVDHGKVVVVVVAVGIRRAGSRDDVYEVAKKLLRWQILP